jgi:ribonuclease J
MPIHGELRQLKRHAELAKEVGIEEKNIIVAENGQVVELSGGSFRLGQRIPGGYVFVDGESIGDIDHGVMREREQLSRNGILLVDLNVNKLSGRLLQDPEVVTRGFLSPEDAERLIPEVRKRVMGIVNHNGMDSEKDIAGAVKSYLYEETGRRPMVFVTLSKT